MSAPKTLPLEARQAAVPAEASPLWALVLILAEIAARIERRRAEEHVMNEDEAA